MGSYSGRSPHVVIHAAGSSGSGSVPPGKIGTEVTLGVDSQAPTIARQSQPASPPAQDPLIGREIRHSYIIRQRIGVGGMGMVYIADQVGLHRPVAVKIINADLATDIEALQRFHREAQALARLAHPNIVTIHEFGVKEEEPCKGHPFFVMEYVKGHESLESVLALHPDGLPLEVAASYLRSILAALHEAHNVGIVHRDLKPGNVLLQALADGSRVPKVCDFGLAKEVLTPSANQTTEGAFRGTPGYMSPEQLRGQEVDHRTDIFAAGIIFFEMLTGGKNPFGVTENAAFADIIAAYLTRKPIPVRELRPDVPPAVEEFIAHTLTHAREDRIQSAQEMSERLDRVMLEATAIPLTPTPPRAPPKERDRTWFITLAFMGVAVLIAASIMGIRRQISGPEPRRPQTIAPRVERVERVEKAPAAPTPSKVVTAAPQPSLEREREMAKLRTQCLDSMRGGYVRQSAARAACQRYLALAPAGDRFADEFRRALRSPPVRRIRRVAPAPLPAPSADEPADEPESEPDQEPPP